MYCYGANIGFYGLAYLFTMVVTSEVFLPVFYKLTITSTYEVSDKCFPLVRMWNCVVLQSSVKLLIKDQNTSILCTWYMMPVILVSK